MPHFKRSVDQRWYKWCGSYECWFVVAISLVIISMKNKIEPKYRRIVKALKRVHIFEPNQRVFFAVRPRHAGEKDTVQTHFMRSSSSQCWKIKMSGVCFSKNIASYARARNGICVLPPISAAKWNTNRFSRRRLRRWKSEEEGKELICDVRGAARCVYNGGGKWWWTRI